MEIILKDQERAEQAKKKRRQNLPSYEDYRTRNDAVMIPDRGFSKQLHALDPELDVVWDWGSEKWEIWRFPKDGKDPFHVMTVQTKDRTYRELGADVLIKLQAGDPHKYTLKELCDYFEELDRQVQRRKQQEFLDKIHSITLDTFNYSKNILQIQVPKEFRIRRAIGDASGIIL